MAAMFRLCANLLRRHTALLAKEAVVLNTPVTTPIKLQNVANFNTFVTLPPVKKSPSNNMLFTSILQNPKIQNMISSSQSRSITKFSLSKGKRKTCKAVISRFYRLHWGIWIRTMAGRHKRMWKKSGNNKRRMRQHVFTNATQSYLLDKMVTKFWRKPKFWVDSPYEPYHTRNEYPGTCMKPRDYWKE